VPQPIEKLLFVGFNARVAALDADTGDMVWRWKASSRAGGYVTLQLLGTTHLIAAIDGYIHCLDPMTGEPIWYNDTRGFGTGVTSIVAFGAPASHHSVIAGADAIARANSA
jgi:outer membrane protein assembly factor BamB